MRRIFQHGTSKVGLPPGSVVFTGSQKVERVELHLLRYGPDTFEETTTAKLSDVPVPKEGDTGVVWLNVIGLHDTELVETVCKHFGVHPLAMEDVVAVNIRPTTADYDSHVYAALKAISMDESEEVHLEHVSLIFGRGWVVSFQERHPDIFESVRRRVREGRTRIRSRGADYLWYALIDAAVDSYLVTVDVLASWAETLEERVWEDDHTHGDLPSVVQEVRRELMMVRKALRPLRDELDGLHRDPPALVKKETRPFLGDAREHVVQMADTLDNIREVLSSVMDAHFSIVSMRTNDVMKVLTIMASIFIPLTFIAGVYGMNFTHMPELNVAWAYPLVWVVMGIVGGGMVVFFRRKNWL